MRSHTAEPGPISIVRRYDEITEIDDFCMPGCPVRLAVDVRGVYSFARHVQTLERWRETLDERGGSLVLVNLNSLQVAVPTDDWKDAGWEKRQMRRQDRCHLGCLRRIEFRRPVPLAPTDSRRSVAVIIEAVGDNMIRTQISLEREEYDLARNQAAALGISIAEFVRRAVREQLPTRGDGAWMKYAGFVETGDLNSSQSIDEIVYGTKG